MKAAKAKRVASGEVTTLGRDQQGAWILVRAPGHSSARPGARLVRLPGGLHPRPIAGAAVGFVYLHNATDFGGR